MEEKEEEGQSSRARAGGYNDDKNAKTEAKARGGIARVVERDALFWGVYVVFFFFLSSGVLQEGSRCVARGTGCGTGRSVSSVV